MKKEGFGEWDDNDFQSAENFTHIFNKVREDWNNKGGNSSITSKTSSVIENQRAIHHHLLPLPLPHSC